MMKTQTLTALLGGFAVVALIGGYFLTQDPSRGDIWSSLWTVVLGVSIALTMLAASQSNESFLNLLLFAVCGGAVGWVVGIMATPATADEERIFGEYKTAIVGFLSGFAVSKFNDVWRILTEGTTPRLLSRNVLTRLLLFWSLFFLLVAQQYNVRRSAAGRILVSTFVEPASAMVQQTLGTVTVRPGATVTLKGAAAYPNMEVDWSLVQDTALAKASTLTDSTLTVPEVSKLADVKNGEAASVIATSRWNHSTRETLRIMLVKEPPTEGAKAQPQPIR
jgi:hypothetical protein